MRIIQKLRAVRKLFYRTKKVPLVLQFEMVECGAASLSMILRFFGYFLGLPELRTACGVSRDGSNMLNIKRAAIRYGLDVQAARLDSAELAESEHLFPVIAWWNHNHFLVVEGYRLGRFLLVDPAGGRYGLDTEDFSKSFSGLVLSMKPGPAFEKRGKQESFLKLFLPYVWSYKYSILFLFAIAVAMLIPSLANPGLSGAFVSEFLQNKRYSLGIPIVWLTIFMSLLATGLSLVELKVIRRMALQVQRTLSLQIALKLFTVDYSFFSSRYLGDISGRLGLANSVSSILIHQMIPAVYGLVGALLTLPFIVLISWQLSLVSLVYVLLTTALSVYSAHYVLDSRRSIEVESGKLSGISVRMFTDTKTIKSSGLQASYLERYQELYAPVLEKQQSIQAVSSIFSWVGTLIETLYSYGTIAFSGYLVMVGEINLAGFMAFQVLRSQVTAPLLGVSSLINSYQNAAAELCRLEDLYQAKDDPKVRSLDTLREQFSLPSEDTAKQIHSSELDSLSSPSVQLDNVSLTFSPIKPPVIRDVNLVIHPGMMVTFVGPSGSGKSTILKLVSGLYQPSSGAIRFDGSMWSDYQPHVLHQQIGYVAQESNAFRGSIHDNITMFNPHWSQDDVIRAADLALLSPVLNDLPQGTETLLGDSGTGLSGGQLQRLEIARALVKEPSILCLDEATSALDTPTETKLLQQLCTKGFTMLCVSHRLVSAKMSDLVVAIKEGEIIEAGHPDELAGDPNSYFSFLLSQDPDQDKGRGL